MGLHSPFSYVDYEVPLAELFIAILDKLCAHCHTNKDYERGCRGCPAGNLLYECKDYLLTAEESDKRFELYASDEWAKRRAENNLPVPSEEERARDLEMADAYRPECDTLRAMKARIKRITPHSFFYVRDSKRGHRRPKSLSEFVELAECLSKAREYRLRKWGL